MRVEEIYRVSLKNFLFYTILLVILIVISILLSVSVGSTISLGDIVQSLIRTPTSTDDPVLTILLLRLGRTVAAVLVGFSLALSGLLMQTVTRNPLADPYIFGLSTSSLAFAALGMILALEYRLSLAYERYYVITIAFAGAMVGYMITLTLSRIAGGGVLSMTLAGVAVSTFFSSISSVLLYLLQSMTGSPYIYLLVGGFFETLLWRDIPYILYSLIICLITSLLLYKYLNAYLYGDEYSRVVGYNPSVTRVLASLVASLATATTVSLVGVIGFIGIAAPHIARSLVGSDHRYTILITMLVGGLVTLLADIIARVISMSLSIGSIPTGFITALIGSPFLAYVVIRRVRS